MALLALWNPNIQFLKTDGTINAGGKIVVTDHNDAESIPANYSDADGTTLNSSPIVLDALGRATCYIDDGSTYDLYVKDANGATLWTVHEMTTGTETIVVSGGFSVSSNDRSVAVTISVNSDGVTNYDLSIQDEIDRATEAEKGLADAIEAEKTRAEEAESAISKSITDETERATEAEKGLADSIEAEKNRAEEAERTLSKSITDETERAIAAEKASRTEIVAGDNITVEKTVGTDGQDVYTVSGEREDNLVDDVRVNGASVVTDKVANIDVPVAGTASPLMDGKASVGNSLKYAREDHVHPSDTSKEDKANKTTVVIGTSDSKYPTDKAVADFVNSSIATNTANYISNSGGPFTSVAQLEAYSGTVKNNDYAFVTGTDSDGNTYYDRYKATVSGSTVTWSLEYRLNNSSFTAAQWAAINSGITSALVAKIHEHGNKAVLDGITSYKVTSWDGKEDAFDILPTTKGGTGTNAASKSALTSTLINSLSTESSTPEDADYYVSQHARGGTITTSYHRRPVSALWEYIKNKISSALGLTSSSYSGNAATATKPAVTTLTESDNLNNVCGSTAGDVLLYKWSFGSAPANVPVAGSSVMEVVRTHSEADDITQTVYTAFYSVYRRECINGTWGGWYEYSKSTHTHGNITSGGALQTTDVAIANGDKLVVTDSSDSSKVARASIAFDGSTTTQALTKAGTWATFNYYSHPAGSSPSKTGVPTANATPGFGGTFKVNQITTDATSHVSAVTERTITIPNTTATTSAAGLMSAADKKKLDEVNEKGLTIKTISGEQVICFE